MPSNLPELPESSQFAPQMITEDAYTRAQMIKHGRQCAEAAAAAERERISDAISDALSSDLENGVKWLNEKAADDFKQGYPALHAFLSNLRKGP